MIRHILILFLIYASDGMVSRLSLSFQSSFQSISAAVILLAGKIFQKSERYCRSTLTSIAKRFLGKISDPKQVKSAKLQRF